MEKVSEETAANTVVAVMLTAGADRGYRSLDVFLTWFVAGTAAALGLAVANLDRLQGLVTLATVKSSLPILGLALLLVLLCKFCGSVICTMAGSMEATFASMKQLEAAGIDAPSAQAFREALDRSRPWPLRVRRSTKGASNQGRKVMRLMMASGLFAICAALLTVLFWYQLISPGLRQAA